MDYLIRPLTTADEPVLWDMLYQALQTSEGVTPHEIIRQPQFAAYVEGWGREGDIGFLAHDKKDGSVIGAVWLRSPLNGKKRGEEAAPELAFAVKAGHRGHGIGSALLTQLVRANPQKSAISVRRMAGKPVLRLYERFGFKVAEQTPDAIIMRREA